jgi:hypothetical protein
MLDDDDDKDEKKGVTLRGLRISEKKEILHKPTVL